MTTRFFLGVIAVAGLAFLAGCVSTVDGRKQPGVSFSKSKIEGRYTVKAIELWQAAKDVLSQLGTITSDDILRSVVEARVDTRTVWVKVEEVEEKLSQATVQARSKTGAGDRELAIFIDKQIAVRLATGKVGPAVTGKRAP